MSYCELVLGLFVVTVFQAGTHFQQLVYIEFSISKMSTHIYLVPVENGSLTMRYFQYNYNCEQMCTISNYTGF